MLNFKVLDRGMIEREDRRRVQQRITNMLSEAKCIYNIYFLKIFLLWLDYLTRYLFS